MEKPCTAIPSSSENDTTDSDLLQEDVRSRPVRRIPKHIAGFIHREAKEVRPSEETDDDDSESDSCDSTSDSCSDDSCDSTSDSYSECSYDSSSGSGKSENNGSGSDYSSDSAEEYFSDDQLVR